MNKKRIVRRRFALACTGLWLVVFGAGAIGEIFYGMYDAPLALAAYSQPTSTISWAIVDCLRDMTHPVRLAAERIIIYVPLLVGGLIQYSAIGYLLGRLVQLLRIELSK